MTPFWFFLLHLLVRARGEAVAGARPGCPDKCGNITVPYPFGIAPDCNRRGFRLTCDGSYNPPKLFLPFNRMPVREVRNSELVAEAAVLRNCYQPLNLGPDVSLTTIDLRGSPYSLSSKRNRFIALGCDTLAISYRIANTIDSASGCLAVCINPSSITNGTCDGIGCCQTSIPLGLKRLDASLISMKKHTETFNFSPCGFAFVVDQDSYTFRLADLFDFIHQSRVPIILDWAIGSVPCEIAVKSSNYACGSNSYCVNATNAQGYGCRCKNGYKGNPYLENGCEDIDECANFSASPCTNICTNLPGGYSCSCPKGTTGDGKKSGTRCIPSRSLPLIQIVLGVGLGSVFLIVICTWGYWALKKRRMILLRENFFKQNGGLMLQQRISSYGSAAGGAMIFSAEELEKATDNYSGSRILGKGGYGTVYKGILPDKRVVAIKKSKIVDETQVEQFINEIVVLSQVIHRNVVKILGCCLEAQVPLLVYEYIPNDTLTHHLHDRDHVSSLSWETRLRIAAETASALAYLHSSATLSIVHRDVKTANILLDEDFTAKVSDFGASRLIPLGKGHINTLVQGTMGYLDPEYFQTGLLTESSDVYSFGVVLAELLTGQKPLSPLRPEEEQNLAIFFLRAMRRNQLRNILEPRIRNEGSTEQLEAIARVAEQCLSIRGADRPTMKDVAADLQRLRVSTAHPWLHGTPNTSAVASGASTKKDFSEEESLLYGEG